MVNLDMDSDGQSITDDPLRNPNRKKRGLLANLEKRGAEALRKQPADFDNVERSDGFVNGNRNGQAVVVQSYTAPLTISVAPASNGRQQSGVRQNQTVVAAMVAPTKSVEEPTRKLTPRHLPQHLQQALLSPSPRTSLNVSTSLADLTAKAEKAPTSTPRPGQQVQTMRQLSVKQLRTRSYLVGSVGGVLTFGSELESHLPDKLLRVYAGSWNMGACKRLPGDVENFVLPEGLDVTAHVLVIGTQESFGDRREWLYRIQEALGSYFVCFYHGAHGSLMTAVFLRRELIWFCSAPTSASISTSPAFQPIATKGCLAITFELFGTSFLFLNSHFSAGEGNMADRVSDYRKTISELAITKGSRGLSAAAQPQRKTAPNSGASSARFNFFGRGIASATVRPANSEQPSPVQHATQTDLTSQFDCCIWLGDFNFRVGRARQHVESILDGISQQQQAPPSTSAGLLTIQLNNGVSYEDLLAHDEMSVEMTMGRLFSGFQEGKIRFRPTYKFDIGTSAYDSSPKERVQSYTDRILFRSKRKNGVTCLAYDSVEKFTESDHKPVYALLEVELRPGVDAVPTGAGCFDRGVYLDGLKRRAQLVGHARVGQPSSAVCTIQ